MNPIHSGLDNIKRNLSQSAQTLEQLWQGYQQLWQQAGWDQGQLRLWLSALPDINIQNSDSDNPEYSFASNEAQGDDLGSLILQTVDNLGGRVQINALLQKLPVEMVTIEQIKVAVNQHPELSLMGPFVRRH